MISPIDILTTLLSECLWFVAQRLNKDAGFGSYIPKTFSQRITFGRYVISGWPARLRYFF